MRKVFTIGSIGVVFVLVLASFPSVVNAESLKTKLNKDLIKTKSDWFPGYNLALFLFYLLIHVGTIIIQGAAGLFAFLWLIYTTIISGNWDL